MCKQKTLFSILEKCPILNQFIGSINHFSYKKSANIEKIGFSLFNWVVLKNYYGGKPGSTALFYTLFIALTMLSSTALRAVLLVLVAVLLSMGDALAGTPFTRALKRGHGYVHRPYCKQYKGNGTRGLFARR